MKRTFRFALAAFAIVAAASCAKEIAPAEQETSTDKLVTMEFSATREEGTKATLNATRQVLWTEDDDIFVYDDKSAYGHMLSLSSGAGTKNGKFSGEVGEGATEFWAVSPTKNVMSRDGDNLGLMLVREQHVNVESPASKFALLSCAYSTTPGSLQFKNVVSLIQFTVKAEDKIKQVRLSGNNGEILAGKFTVNAKTGEVVTMPEAPEAYTEVFAVASTSNGYFEDGTYYLCIIPTEFTKGLTLTFEKDGAVAMMTSSTAADAQRNAGINLGTVKPAKWLPVNIKTAADLKTFAENASLYPESTDVIFVNDIDMTDVTIAPDKDQSFAGTLNGNGHSITNWTTSKALINTLEASGSISNLTLDASCNLNPASTLSKKFNAFVANENYGTATNVVNNANVTWNVDAFTEGAIGIIFGYSDNGAKLYNCVNNGSLTINAPGNTVATFYIGTVSGRCNALETLMDGCCNNGNLDININDASSVKNFYIGGVSGSATNGSTTYQCVNKGNITLNTKGQGAAVILGGVVSYSSGKTSYCENHGDISYLSESSVKASAVAGIAGYQDGTKGSVDNCINKGVITLKAGYLSGRNSIGGFDGTKSYSKMHASVAGIVAYAYKCEFNNCDNYGKLFFTFDDLLNASSTFSGRAQMAGVVANTWGKLENCNNYGDIKLVHHAEGRADMGTKNSMPIVGGIAGGDYAATYDIQDDTDIINCLNEGNITIDCDCRNSNCAFGGIVGWPHKEETGITHVTKGCTNRGNITVSGAGKSRTGGISGGSGPLQDCVNYGTITVSEQNAASAVGGVIGFITKDHVVSGCCNYGNIVSNVNFTGGTGGLFGGRGNVEAKTGAGCKVNCSVTVPEGTTEVGIIVGHWNDKTKSVTLGTVESPILVKGSIVNGGETTVLTAENYSSYLWGSANYKNTVHTVNASYGE